MFSRYFPCASMARWSVRCFESCSCSCDCISICFISASPTSWSPSNADGSSPDAPDPGVTEAAGSMSSPRNSRMPPATCAGGTSAGGSGNPYSAGIAGGADATVIRSGGKLAAAASSRSMRAFSSAARARAALRSEALGRRRSTRLSFPPPPAASPDASLRFSPTSGALAGLAALSCRRYFCRWLLTCWMFMPSTSMICMTPLGVAISSPPSRSTASTNRLCSWGVQRRRCLPCARAPGFFSTPESVLARFAPAGAADDVPSGAPGTPAPAAMAALGGATSAPPAPPGGPPSNPRTSPKRPGGKALGVAIPEAPSKAVGKPCAW